MNISVGRDPYTLLLDSVFLIFFLLIIPFYTIHSIFLFLITCNDLQEAYGICFVKKTIFCFLINLSY